MNRIIFIILILLSALRVSATTMVRVLAVEDGRTLAVDRNGTRERVHLAGVAITDELRARELLRWTLGTSWVMLEPAHDGTFRVYRSPDALFVNRELVLRGFARATLAGIEPENAVIGRYLGEVNPAGPQSRPEATAAPESRSGNAKSARPRATPRRRPPTRSRSGGGR